METLVITVRIPRHERSDQLLTELRDIFARVADAVGGCAGELPSEVADRRGAERAAVLEWK
jgi:hypothetical protein